MVQHYPYLIIGGGMTADSAARGIRQVDSSTPIGMLCAEPDPPYNRPPLSKGLWKRLKLNAIWRQTAQLGVDLLTSRKAVQLDAGQKRVVDELGNEYSYDRLLLATGGTPIRLPYGGDDIIYFRYLSDYQRLRALAAEKERFVVIGGGFIGSEIAAALAGQGKQVSMIFLEAGLGARLFPPDIVRYVTGYYQDHGVQIYSQQGVAAVERENGRLVVTTSGGERLTADAVVAGVGIRPEVELARQAGLKIDNGIVVDESLRTSNPDIFAAGDAANFYNPLLGKRIRVEHEENANQGGLAAGLAMAGQAVHYDLLPMAYSDLFDLGYESVGEVDSRLEVTTDWIEPYHKGVLYYRQDGRVRGVVTWNLYGKMDQARALIARKEPFHPEAMARIQA